MRSMSVAQYVDILMLSETKLDSTFPSIQFLINGFSGTKNGFEQSRQKLNQRLFTSTYRRYSVLLNANRKKKNLGEKRRSQINS